MLDEMLPVDVSMAPYNDVDVHECATLLYDGCTAMFYNKGTRQCWLYEGDVDKANYTSSSYTTCYTVRFEASKLFI